MLISIHAPLAGCDSKGWNDDTNYYTFQSTHPLRGATHIKAASADQIAISIHAPLAGCDRMSITSLSSALFQSTHPLRGATVGVSLTSDISAISIHAPLAGCDYNCFPAYLRIVAFQSTHPLRGATGQYNDIIHMSQGFQSTHPLRGATCAIRHSYSQPLFQSTHPLRGAT